MIHKLIEPFTLVALREVAETRSIYIWGAGNQGRGIAKVLVNENIGLAGFIDSSQELIGSEVMNLLVHTHDSILSHIDQPIFIIIASFFYEAEMAEMCKHAGLEEGVSYVHYSRLKPRDYSIDISGACNLKCVSCPRAERSSNERSAGLMSLDTFQQVITKIKKDDPFVGNIQLYQWGEPTLNPNLPNMIAYARAQGINSAISSNLNLAKVDYRAIVAAKPERFRISASAWGKKYEIAHTGGKWEQFIENVELLAKLRNELYPEMKIELYYHVYKHSLGEGVARFRRLCENYNIEFKPVYAYLISLDDVLRYQEGVPLPEAAQLAKDAMLMDLDEGLAMAKAEKRLSCDAIRSVHINWDTSVSHCMMYYFPQENIAVPDYLDQSIEDITQKRLSSDLCKRCIKQGLHRYCSVYSKEPTDVEELIHGNG